MLKKLQTKKEGFTIVETLIVLAIAGLIILIVLLAVPALQRNAKNSDIKSDAEAVTSAISEYEENNSDSTPALTAQAGGTAATYTIGATGTNTAVAKIQEATAVIVLTALPAVTAHQPAGTISLLKGHSCEGIANASDIAVWYSLETGTNTYSYYTHDNASCLDT